MSHGPRWQLWMARMALATAMATALAYFPYKLLDGSSARKVAELGVQYQRTMESAQVLAEENARLRREIDALVTEPSAILDIARDELGMVRPGEIIIRIEEGP